MLVKDRTEHPRLGARSSADLPTGNLDPRRDQQASHTSPTKSIMKGPTNMPALPDPDEHPGCKASDIDDENNGSGGWNSLSPEELQIQQNRWQNPVSLLLSSCIGLVPHGHPWEKNIWLSTVDQSNLRGPQRYRAITEFTETLAHHYSKNHSLLNMKMVTEIHQASSVTASTQRLLLDLPIHSLLSCPHLNLMPRIWRGGSKFSCESTSFSAKRVSTLTPFAILALFRSSSSAAQLWTMPQRGIRANSTLRLAQPATQKTCPAGGLLMRATTRTMILFAKILATRMSTITILLCECRSTAGSRS